jgi:hypothetical protein
VAATKNGGIDYDGVFGDINFDAAGDHTPITAVWCISRSTATPPLVPTRAGSDYALNPATKLLVGTNTCF